MIGCVVAFALLSNRLQSSSKVDTLAADLKQALQENKTSYEGYLRAAKNLIFGAINDKDWSLVKKSLDKQGIREPYHIPYFDYHPFELGAFPYILPNGKKMLVEAEINTSPVVSDKDPTWIKSTVYTVSLNSNVEEPIQTIRTSKFFPSGTLLDALLNEPSVVSFGAKHQVVGSIEMTYGLAELGWSSSYSKDDLFPYRFKMKVVFNDHSKYWTRSFDGTYLAESFLDPLVTLDLKHKQMRGPTKQAFGPIQTEIAPDWMPQVGVSEYDRGGFLNRKGVNRATESSREAPSAYTGADLRLLPNRASSLRLVVNQLSTEGLSQLSRLPNLRDLSVVDENYITLGWNSDVTDIDWGVIRGLRKLRSLEMISKRVGEPTVSVISQLPNLRELVLDCEMLSDSAVTELAKLSQLTSLSIYTHSGSGIADHSLEAIAKLDHLKLLDLGFTGSYTKQGLDKLVGLRDLQSLELHGFAQHDDADLLFLSGLGHLTDLTLVEMTLGPKSIEAIANLKHLRTLGFYRVKGLTNDLIVSLTKLKGLNQLDFQDDPGVTAAGVDALRHRMHGSFELY
jgi:hypothetical protein